MKKFKLVSKFLVIAMSLSILGTGTSIEAKAEEKPVDFGTATGLYKQNPRPYVEYAGVDHYPVLKSEKVTIDITSKYEGDYSPYNKYDTVHYRAFITNIEKEEYKEITTGYSKAVAAQDTFTIKYDTPLTVGKFKIMVLVKKSSAEGINKGDYGDYDNVYYINFICFDNAPSEDLTSLGISSGNASNDGLAVEDKDYIYYLNRFGDIYGTSPDYIFKMKKNAPERKDLCDVDFNTQLITDRAWNLNLVGDWIYYSNWINPFQRGIYKVKTDGTKKTLIANEAVGKMIVRGNWIYYVRKTNTFSSENNNLYKMSIDGSCRIQLNKDSVEDMVLSGDWIYYGNGSDSYKPYRIKINGTNRQKISDDETLFMTGINDKIYYSNLSDGCSLYSINGDGTDRKKLSSDSVSFINATSDSIYYVNESDEGTLYRMHLNGKARTKLTSYGGSSITVLNDKIYFNDIFFNKNN